MFAGKPYEKQNVVTTSRRTQFSESDDFLGFRDVFGQYRSTFNKQIPDESIKRAEHTSPTRATTKYNRSFLVHEKADGTRRNRREHNWKIKRRLKKNLR